MNCVSYAHYYGDEGLTFQPRFWRVKAVLVLFVPFGFKWESIVTRSKINDLYCVRLGMGYG